MVSSHWAIMKLIDYFLDINPLVPQSSAYCRIPGSNTVPLRPLNVAEDPASLPSYPALHKPYIHIHDYIPEATGIDVRLTGIHGSGAIGLSGMPRHVPGSALC
jgi:hypothetical protein